MRKLILLAILAIPIIILLTFPIKVLVPHVNVPDSLGQVNGTVWRGSARWSQSGHAPLDLSWRWQGGRQWQFNARDEGTDLSGYLRPGEGRAVHDLTGRLDLDRVDVAFWLLGTRPTGHLMLDISEARLESGQTPHLAGRVIWEEAALEGRVQERLGRVAIDLEPGQDLQKARIRSLDPAPVQVRGEIQANGQGYEVDVWLRASPDRPDLISQLESLGEVQPDGQVRLQRRGALGW
jgi:hypothetical protein